MKIKEEFTFGGIATDTLITKNQHTDTVQSGYITAVKGSVVDVQFQGKLPALNQELRTGEQAQIVLEVISHLGHQTLRCIALTPTQGLARGDTVMDTGHPLQVPVGKNLLVHSPRSFSSGNRKLDVGDKVWLKRKLVQ